MIKTTGKEIPFEKVKQLNDGTQIWIESSYPERNCFLGIKSGSVIKDVDGNIKWAIAEDFKVLCKAYEMIEAATPKDFKGSAVYLTAKEKMIIYSALKKEDVEEINEMYWNDYRDAMEKVKPN